MKQNMQQEFSKWRSFFWPIHGHEMKKVLPLLLMFFFIVFNYTILRDTKEALVITAPGSGAEIIPFIKVWLIVPSAILFMLVYAKLSNLLSKQALFYATIIPFLLFFALFAFVLYPAKDTLHPSQTADLLTTLLPAGFKGFIALYRNWTFALFYVLAELWGSVILSLVFWGFANQITRVSEAKRFYALLGLGGNTAPFFSGSIVIYISNLSNANPSADRWQNSLELLMSLVLIVGFLIMVCYFWMNKYTLKDPLLYAPEEITQSKNLESRPVKPKMSLKESFLFLAKSKYLLCIATLVIAYAISINLIEVSWKHQVKLQYPEANDYSNFMGHFSMFTGILSLFMVLFVGGNVIRKFGWLVAAEATPIVLLITGIAFFVFIIFNDNMTWIIDIVGLTPLMCAVIFGAIQNILSKCTKFSLFDPTKEMAYIPLDEESKVKGKAAIDVVGSRLGKSGGSLIQQGLLIMLGTIGAMAPYIAIIMCGVIIAWIFGAKSLGKQFAALSIPSNSK